MIDAGLEQKYIKEALSRVLALVLVRVGIEVRPVWKPMHFQPVYRRGEVKSEKLKVKNYEIICQTSESSVAYINGVSEAIFKVGMCLPAGSSMTDVM